MNPSESIVALAVFGAIMYGTWKVVERVEKEEKERAAKSEAFTERLITAIEQIAQNGKTA